MWHFSIINQMATVHHLQELSGLELVKDLKRELEIQWPCTAAAMASCLGLGLKMISIENAIFYKQSTASHLIVLDSQTSQEKYRIISRGAQKPLAITKTLLRQYMGKSSNRDKRIQELDNILSNNYAKKTEQNRISIGVYPRIENQELVYFSYVEEINSFLLAHKDILTVINHQQHNQKAQQEGQLESWIYGLSQQQRVQLIYQLSSHTFVGQLQNNSAEFFLIVKNSTGQVHSLETTKHLFKRLGVPKSAEMLKEGQMYEDYEDILSKLQSYIEGIENSYDLQHKIVRVLNSSRIIVEFLVANNELAIYEKMRQCISSNQQFISQKGHFPQLYYSKVHSIYKEHFGSLAQYKTSEAIKYVLYSQQMCLPLYQILESPFRHEIGSIRYNQFQNCAISTFLIYLVIGPPGMRKSQMISVLGQKVERMGCQRLTLTMADADKLQWEIGDAKKFMSKQGVFDSSQYAFLFLDFPFHPELPSIIKQSISSICPEDRHYRILHVMPQCSEPFSFHHEILNKRITFPFETSLLLYCLKSIEKRGQGYNRKLQPIQNLSRLIHSISFSFRNFRQELYEGTRLRTVKIAYRVQFKEVAQSMIISLQQLLEMSYKKEYTENEHILYYLLEGLQSLQMLQEPDLESVCQTILTYSFRKLPYFQLS